MATAQFIDDSALSLESAAAVLGVSSDRVLAWMVDNDWLVMGDTSYDVVQNQIEAGHLSNRHGSVRVTVEGMQILHREIKPQTRRPAPRIAGGDANPGQNAPPF